MKKLGVSSCLLLMSMVMYAQSAIDLHSHFTTPAFLKVLAEHDA